MKNKKRLVLCLCCALMISTVPMAISCGGGGKSSADSASETVETFEGGEYYADGSGEAAGVINTLSLTSDGAVTLTLDGATLTGTYKYKNNAFTMTFSGGATATAQESNGAIVLTYNGTTYTFVEKIEYTVSYSVGGTVTSTQKVINGKTLSAPTDPQMGGQVFVGWYTDSAFKNPFAFNSTPITGNITLYARFVQALENEFTVQFMVDGEEAFSAVSTVGGVVTQLPTPSGSLSFVGWWIGDDGKLLEKYEGQVLKENTVLYAVWDDGAPIISVTSTGASWEAKGVNNSYMITITAPDGTVEDSTTTMGSYAYDFASKAPGEYKIEVTLNGKTGVAYYRNKYLAKVSSFQVVDSKLIFVGVENATGYLITSSCGSASHVHDEYNNGASTVYDFSQCEMKQGGITFVVKAVADGWVASESAVYTVERNLTATSVSIDKEKEAATWTAVENATGYEVSVNGTVVATVGASVTSYDLRSYAAGELTVTVTAKAHGYNSASAETVYNKTTLVTPANVKLVASTLTWDAVAGATGYTVKIGDTEYTANTNEFALKSEYFAADATSCEIQVKTLGATAEQNSVYCDAVNVQFGTMSSNVAYANGAVTWDPVLNIKGYEVMLGGQIVSIAATENSCPVSFVSDGTHIIQVRCIKADGTKSNWVETYVEVYEITFEVGEGKEVDSVYAAAGDKVQLSTSTKAGYDFAGWFNTPNGVNGTEYENGFVQGEGDLTVYAHWTAKQYTVSLNAGIGALEDSSAIVTFDQNYTLPRPVTTSEDRFFGGWYTEENGRGIKYTNDAGASRNVWKDTQAVTLYAYWMEDVLNYVEVTDEENGGTGYEVTAGKNVGQMTIVRIPETYKGKTVISIGAGAFANGYSGFDNITKIEMPDTIQSIFRAVGSSRTADSFYGCDNLTEFEVYETAGGHDRHYEAIDGVLVRNYQGAKELVYVAKGREGQTFEIPEGVTFLPDYIFGKALYAKVIIPVSVTEIAADAFNDAYKLQEVEFVAPETDLAEDGSNGLILRENVFYICPELTKITLPARTLELPSSTATDESVPVTFGLVFSSASALQKVNVAAPTTEGACFYTSQDGIILNKDGTELIYCIKNRTGDIDIPTSVSKIAANAFYGCSQIKSVNIHAFVTEIGESAFESCSGMSTLTFNGKATDGAINIATKAFYKCSSLTSVELPANLGTLAEYAFGGTSALTDVEVNVGASAQIADKAFGTQGSSPSFHVTTVHIGANVPVISVAAVFGSEKLLNLTVDPNNPNYTIDENGVLYNKVTGEDGSSYPTEILFYPLGLAQESYVVPSTITTIGAEVFTGRAFKTVTIGENVTSIGANAFADCKYLTSVIFENASADLTESNALTIGDNAFLNCDKLSSFALPVRTTTIGATAFSGCKAISGKFVLPENVTTTGKQVFYNCSAITEIEVLGSATSFTLESNVFTATTFCKALTKITVAENNSNYIAVDGVLYKKASGAASELLYCPSMCVGQVVEGVNTLYVPNTVSSVATKAFEHAMAVESVIFLENQDAPVALTLATSAFAANQKDYPSQLKSVALPAGMTKIAASAFASAAITSITIPNTVTLVDSKAFTGCANLTTVVFEEGGTAALTLGTANSTTANGPFNGCSKLTSVNLPERLAIIGAGTFYNTAVTNITIPSTVTAIWNGAFQSCEKLTSVTITDTDALPSKLKNIKGAAFRGASITSINLPDTITEIAAGAFNETQLVSVTMPEGVSTLTTAFQKITTLKEFKFAENNKITAIPNQALDSTAIESIVIPSNVKTIGNRAFNGCSKLTSVTFETDGNGCTSLTKIDYSAFAGTALTEFILPESKSAMTFGYKMFAGCDKLTKVQLPKQITSLANAFEGCYSITEVSLPDNANLIFEDGIIYNLDKTAIQYVMKDIATTELVIPDGVTEIGAYAFMGQTSLKTVSLPAGIKTLGSYAFQNCINLEKVTFRQSDDVAEQLQAINSYTFGGCRSLKEIVNLPSTVLGINTYGFSGCVSLSKINSDEEGTINLPDAFTTFGGSATSNANIFAGCTSIKKVIIPAGVKVISAQAFQNCTGLEEVVFADGSAVTSIGNRAFEGCTALATFDMPDTVTTLGYGAFASSGIETIHMSTALTTMNGQTFMGATKLKSIVLPDGLTTLDYNTFEGCTSLGAWDEEKQAYGEVVLPANLAVMKYNVFKDCTSLTTITLPDSLKMLGEGNSWSTSRKSLAFSGCTSLVTVNLGGVTQIGNEAFKDCISLENIDLSKVTDMNNNVFQGCTSLETIDLSALKKAGASVFADCTALETVTMGAALTTLGNYSFQNCVSLTEIDLPDTLAITSASSSTHLFMNCTSLTSITLPSKVTAITKNMFDGCINLTNVDVEGKITAIGDYAFNGCAKITEFALPSTLTSALGHKIFQGTGITSITLPKAYTKLWSGIYAPFAGCEGLTEIKVADGNPVFYSVDGILYNDNSMVAIPNGKTFEDDTFVIPEDTGFINKTMPFAGCAIKTVVLPESLTIIPESLFRESLVEEVVLGSNVTELKSWVFYDAINLKRVLKKDANGVAQESLEGITTMSSMVFYNTYSLESIVLPDSMTTIPSSAFTGSGIKNVTFGANITAIPANAFQNTGLTSLTIPETITSIGNYAFAGTPLTSVTVTSTATWGQYVFQGCTLLTDVTFADGVTAISNYMFQDCAGLTQVVIPDCVTSIGSYAFAGTGLTGIVVPGSVASIGAYAFDGTPLTEITLNEGLTSIANNAFQGLALTSVVLPSTLTSIGASAFAGCSVLSEINIPASVTSIGATAFNGCTALESIVLTDSIASIGDNAFAGWTEDQIVYVTMSEYEAACKWGVNWSANTNATFVFNYKLA